MALNDTQAPSSGIWSAVKGALGIFTDINKAHGVTENSNPVPIDEYESSYTEQEVIDLVREWKRIYTPYYVDIEATQKLSFSYWVGAQRATEADQVLGNTPLVDNLIFEAVETFLPIASRANPDPLVQADPSDIGQQMAKDIKSALVNEADRQKLRMKLKKLLRHWIIYRIGVAKIVYDLEKNDIDTEIINPKRMLFDKDGYIDEAGRFVGEYLGEKKRIAASALVEMFPAKAAKIRQFVQNKMGTKLEYFEWWYRGRDVFYTIEDTVLGKFKNPHWNYDGEVPTGESDPETGDPIYENISATNHWKYPVAPYVFLSVFSTGLQPHDETSLILQNFGIQDMVNRRWRQMDRNIEGMNNGLVVSGKSFTEEQASQAASALRRGTAIRVPDGDVDKAVKRFPAVPIPADVYQMLTDARGELRNIFGTAGSNPQGIAKEDTARGKILVNQMDSTRIGGGVTEYLEQCADTIYNAWVQFMFVHYNDDHFFLAAGSTGGANLVEMRNDKFPLLKTLTVTVKEGSLVPKDPLTQRNEAIDLWSAGAIDPLNLFKKLDMPDPSEATNQLILWQMLQKGQIQPQQYLPSFQAGQPMQPQQQAPLPPQQGTGGPAVNPIGPNTSPQQPAQASAPAVEQQSKQLLDSVPIH